MNEQNNDKIHLTILDDEIIIRKAICKLISSYDGFEIDIEANSIEELLPKLKNSKTFPDICIVRTGKMIEVLKQLKCLFPLLKVLVLSPIENDYAIAEVMKSGASGYLVSNHSPDEFIKTLVSVSVTDHCHFEIESGNLLHILNAGAHNRPRISDREMKFLSFCCTDYSYKEIAQQMGVAARTVHGYRDSLFEKLQVKTRVRLARFAINMGLVSYHSW